MNMKHYMIALGSLALLVLPSCVVPSNYYGSSHSSLNTSISVLPHGYQTIYVGGSPYYYHGSTWYRRYNNRFIRSSRPSNYHGSIGRSTSYNRGLQRLPSGYNSVNISGSRYYQKGNSWYQRKGNQYYKTSRPTTASRYTKSSSRSQNRVTQSRQKQQSSFNRNQRIQKSPTNTSSSNTIRNSSVRQSSNRRFNNSSGGSSRNGSTSFRNRRNFN